VRSNTIVVSVEQVYFERQDFVARNRKTLPMNRSAKTPRRTRRAYMNRSPMATARSYRAVLIVFPVLLVNLSTILAASVLGVFERLLPLMTLVLEYYFGATR
jgi:hypothetical protein